MVWIELYNLFNAAEDSFLNVFKFLGPLIIILLILLIVKWIQALNNASNPDILVLRRP